MDNEHDAIERSRPEVIALTNHRYKTSRDYDRLFELAQETSVICIVNYQWHDGEVSRDIAATHHNGRSGQISCRGVCYVGPWDNDKETFIRHCAKYNVEFIEPEARR